MNNDKCAPGIEYKNGTCLTLQQLIAMANAHNKVNTKNNNQTSSMNSKKIIIDNDLCDDELINSLIEQFNNIYTECNDDQYCLIKQPFMKELDNDIKNNIKNNTFRPEGPQGKFEWLNTINIEKVMEQYETKYSNFKFLGAVPIDFDDLPVLGLKNINCKKLEKNGKNIVGVVFNLDEHYKSGSHWVAMYANLNNGQLYYFDSYGTKPDIRIINFMKRIARYCRRKGIRKLDVNYNNNRYQYGNSECGVYSINFILRMLKNNNFQDILNNPINDDKINLCRKIYFNNTGKTNSDCNHCE